MADTNTNSLQSVPISARPPKTWSQTLNASLFVLSFLLACLIMNATQIFLLQPLRLIPFEWSRRLCDRGMRYTKGSFGILLVLMCQWFGPTKLVITFERDGQGRFSEKGVEEIIKRDGTGRVIELRLPKKLVLIANHQVYADWWYAWCLTYFMNTHADVLIVLKKSLKWVPIFGWGMQSFKFIFLARSWASDRKYLSSTLASLGGRAQTEHTPLSLIIYPEGTLVSVLTRPVSKKFADKMGIADMQHTLLPRSTGLQYSLRSLAPRVPNLHLLDITVAYPGIPPFGYGQSYYTLRSIFFDRVPPPAIHVHMRLFDVSSVPFGDVSSSNPNVIPNGLEHSSRPNPVEIDVPENERVVFENWLRELWKDKDRLIDKFLETGSFTPRSEKAALEIPIKLRKKREILDAFGLFVPTLTKEMWTTVRGAR